MGTPYIYYIGSSKKGGTYIGQSQGSESSFRRIISHFSGLYHYTDKGHYVNTNENYVGEGALFIDWLKTIPLNSIVTRVFYGPYFGIPKKVWIEFLSQWSPSMYHRSLDGKTKAEQERKAWEAFQAMSDEAKLNSAEIIHIYNAKKRGYTLLQRQMGGQNLNLFKRGSNIILNREMSPAQMVGIIDADDGKMSDFQAIFDKYFQKDVLQNPKFIDILVNDTDLINKLISTPNAAFKRLQTLIDNYLQGPSSHGTTTVLEMLLNAVKDDCSHGQYFRLSWAKKDDDPFSFYDQERNQNYTNFIAAFANQLVRACKNLETTPENFTKDLEKMLKSKFSPIFISVGTLVDIKLLVQYSGLSSFTPLGEVVDISSSLKRISYFYYAHFADMYYNRHSFQINDTNKYFDAEWNFYAKMKGETCTAFVYNKYREEGISAPYMKNWSTWREFNNGMLTIYTKNRGNAFLNNTQPDPQIIREDQKNNQGIEVYAFVFHTELPFINDTPFYEVSPETWRYVVSGLNLAIDQLENY